MAESYGRGKQDICFVITGKLGYNISMDEEVKIEGNLDINQALKEFEAKSQVEEIKEVPEVSKTSDIPKMVQLAMKWFGIKEQRTAEYVLLGFAILMFALSFYFFFI